MRLSPAVEPPPPRGRRGWTIATSVLLHLMALAALIFFVHRPAQNEQIAPSYELMFEGTGGSKEPTAPDKADEQPRSAPAPDSPSSPNDPAPAPPAPPAPAAPTPETPQPIAPQAPAVPDVPPGPAAPPPTAVPVPDAPPEPAPPAPAPPSPPAPAPAVPQPLPPAPAMAAPDSPPAPTVPEVRLETPAPPPPALPPVPELSMPAPPLPMPPVLPPPAPRPAPPRPRAAPPPTAGTFANPMDLSFNQAPVRPPAPRMAAPRNSVASRSMDMSLGAPKPGPNKAEAFFDARAKNLGADWMQGVKAFWLRHRYYPQQAAENGEDGTVDLELTVDRYGRVESATVKSRSGSAWIDMAAVGTFRNAQLPPLPREVNAPYTVTITINYILIR